MMQQDMTINLLKQIHNGKTHLGEYLGALFHDLPIGVFWKNRDSALQGCNQRVAEAFDVLEPGELLGKNDFEICWNESDAKFFIETDQEVQRNNQPKFNIIEQIHHANGRSSTICTTKFPVYDALKNIIGTTGFWIPIDINLTNLMHSYLRNIAHVFRKENNYYMIIDTQIVHLTARQAECLVHLSMGKTIKQIANMLDCANSTIEDHIFRLKQKLGVYTTPSLIDCFWQNPIRWF